VYAAHFYGVGPWELLDKPAVWTRLALTADAVLRQVRSGG